MDPFIYLFFWSNIFMRKKEIEDKWKRVLKGQNEKWTNFHQNIINSFLKLKKISTEVKNENIKNIDSFFGVLFEKIVAFVLADNKAGGIDKYRIIKETTEKNANDGMDIIFPCYSRKEIWAIQVKSGNNWSKDASAYSAKLRDRARELYKQIQNSNYDDSQLAENWKISKKLAKELNDNKDEWDGIKTFWVTSWQGIDDKSNFFLGETERVSLKQLVIKKAKYVAPHLSTVLKDHTFKINTSDFSNTENKAITKGSATDLDVLICPVKISNFINFFESINEKDETIDSLFISNVRDFKGNNDISKKIVHTLKNDEDDFFSMNNGVSIISSKIEMKKNGQKYDFTLKSIDIINGQQTLRTIWNSRNELEGHLKINILS